MATETAPVVAKTAKQTTNKVCLSKVNAFSIAFACFYGFALIIAAIAGFTTKWNFNVPYIGTFLSNTNQTSAWLITAIAALAFGIFGIVTTNKLTDLESVKKSWKVIAGVFLAMAAIFAVEMVATAIYSLMGIGRKSGVSQGSLWLNGFLAQFIAGGAATGMFFLSKAIAAGKVQIIKTLAVLGICLASVAFILVVIQQCVAFYGKSSSAKTNYYDYLYDLGL